MKNIIFLTSCICLLFIGCANIQRTIKIKGKVIDKGTKEPIPMRNVIVQGLIEKNNSLVSIEAGEFSTDSSGNFIFSLRKVKDALTYNFCFVGDSDYTFMAQKLALSYIKKNAKHMSFSLSKLADLTILINRKSKKPAYDTLFLSWRLDGVDGRTIYPYKITNNGLISSSKLRWIGGNVSSTVSTKACADQRTTIRWVLYRNGKKKEFIDTITCKRDLVNYVYFKY